MLHVQDYLSNDYIYHNTKSVIKQCVFILKTTGNAEMFPLVNFLI